MKNFEALMLAGGDAVELRLYGQIGNTMFEEGITAKQVGEALALSPDAKNLNVKLSTPGGAVFEGMAIRSMLAAHPARVTVDIEGLAASAGSVIAMAGDHIRMHDGASMMLHEGRGHVQGDIAALKRAISSLETVNDGAASIYAARSGKSKDEILKLMAAETWLTPLQAKEFGFVDEVVSGKQAPPRMHFDLGRYEYKHVPPQLAAAMKEPPTMSFARIAIALGLSEQSDEAAVTAAVAAMQRNLAGRETLLAELRTASGKQQDSDIAAFMRQRTELVNELRAVTGKQTEAEIIGAVRGLTAVAEALTTLQAQVAERDAQLETQAHAALMEADKNDPKGRKLTPAMEAWAKTQSTSALKAYLDVAPNRIQMAGSGAKLTLAGKQPPVETALGNAGGAGPVVMLHLGKPWEELTSTEKHNLHMDDKETFDAMCAEYKARKKSA